MDKIINRLGWWLINKFPDRSRIIKRAGEKYLHRFYITKPRVTREHEEEQPEQFGLYLHYFYQGDLDEDLHNHPWKWALSLILSGQYAEERENGIHIRKAGRFNYIKHSTFHRVTLVNQDTTPIWTLFMVGPRITSWGFKNKTTGEFWNWKEYLRARGEQL